MLVVTPSDWYWVVAGDNTKYYSSSRNAYVLSSDSAFIAWSAKGNVPSNIASEGELAPYLVGVSPSWQTGVRPTATTYSKAQLTAYAAYKRWIKETSGITVSGVPVATDDRSKIMVTGARVAAEADAGWSTKWQGSDGVSYDVNAATMIAISNSVQSHVNDCFEAYATTAASIAGNSITTLAQIDTAFV